MSLRNKIIRLAHEKPELRKHLLPLVKKAATRDEKNKIMRTLQQAATALDTAELQMENISQLVSDKQYDEYYRGGLLDSKFTMGVSSLKREVYELMAEIKRSK